VGYSLRLCLTGYRHNSRKRVRGITASAFKLVG
jgi:hypothetical protein